MRILHVSSTDLVGRRFNGQNIVQYLNGRPAEKDGKPQHHGSQLVWAKAGHDPNTAQLYRLPVFSNFFHRLMDKLEQMLSIRALLHPTSFLLAWNEKFKKADLVHYHLIYWPSYFSLLALPFLTRLRPSVWTIHDLWPITGHCVYPGDCERWTIGCGSCPDLKTNFKMRKDRTRLNWKIKRAIYQRSKLHLVVASQFMFDRVSRSPLMKGMPISIVPFGVDLQYFAPGDNVLAKRLLGIEPDEVVISFRAAPGEFKGFNYVLQALRNIKTDKKICLLSFNDRQLLEEFRYKFKVLEMGWVNNEEVMKNAYLAADFFLMPSTQEAFGMMAMEAMACGKPVVVFDGTSLPEVVGGSEIGIVVRQGDRTGLAEAVNRLIEDEEFRLERGRRSRAFAEKKYSFDLHVHRLLDVYEKAVCAFKKEKPSEDFDSAMSMRQKISE